MRNIVLIAWLMLGATLHAQWLNYRAAGTPVKPDGKVDLAAPAPRAPDGKPDLTGVWHLQRGPSGPTNNVAAGPAGVDPGSLTANIFRDMKPEDIPEKPEAAKVRIDRTKDGKRLNPSVFCLPMGIPTANFLTEVTKFVQAPKEIIVMHEVDGTHRQIYTDGRPLPKDPSPAWLGYSTARWEGDTLVVETEGFNDKTWLDMNGHSHSEALHVTERYHRRDFGHMDVEMTFNDSVFYSRPFTIKFTHELVADSDILESFCAENERSREHIMQVK
ncbi:MAG: hypothetical protein ABL967_18860 [Bryobacteraceae bacterium]